MIALAAQVVKWSDLGKEAIIAFVAGVGVVFAWGLVVIGSTRVSAARAGGETGESVGEAGRPDGETSGRTRAAGTTGGMLGGIALATVGAVVCLAAVVLGIIAMAHKS